MSDPAPPTPPPIKSARVSWRRVRIFLWSILIVAALDFYGSVRMIREHPKRVVEGVLAALPVSTSVGTVTWLDPNRLEFRDVKIGDFFYADSIIVTGSVYQLLRHHVTELDVLGPQLFTAPLYDYLAKHQNGGDSAGLDWTITKLVIHRGTLLLSNLAPDMPPIPIRLGIRQPIILNYVKLNKPDASPSMTRERVMDLENVLIVSPFDPLSPVLSFPLIKLRFTYSELWHHNIREIQLIRPMLYLGQDLFWFSDQFKKERASAPGEGVHAPWQVGLFQVNYGQLAINVFGQPKVTLPFYFETQVNSIRLDQLDKISAKSTIAIQRLDQDYPDYKIKIDNLSGKLEFSIPPTDVNANNVVPTVHIDKLAWNGIAATDVWSSVTFDPTGIYGRLGGNCEKGYLKGNFEVYYTNGFAWNANFFCRQHQLPTDRRQAGREIFQPHRDARRRDRRPREGDQDRRLQRRAAPGAPRPAGDPLGRQLDEPASRQGGLP